MMKRALSILLAPMLCLTMLPTAALAEVLQPENPATMAEPQPTDPLEPKEDSVAEVQAMIDALPTEETLTAEDYETVLAAYEAYAALSEEEQARVTGAERLEELLAWFNNQTAPYTLSGSTTEQAASVIKITPEGSEVSYYYDTVAAALRDRLDQLGVTEHFTMTLLKDATVEPEAGFGYVYLSGLAVFDLGGHTLTSTGMVIIQGANQTELTIKNGTVQTTSAEAQELIHQNDKCELYLEDVTLVGPVSDGQRRPALYAPYHAIIRGNSTFIGGVNLETGQGYYELYSGTFTTGAAAGVTPNSYSIFTQDGTNVSILNLLKGSTVFANSAGDVINAAEKCTWITVSKNYQGYALTEDVTIVAHVSHTYDPATGQCLCGEPCPHETLYTDNDGHTEGACTICGKQAAIAKIGTTYYRDIAALNEAAKGVTGHPTLTILCDITGNLKLVKSELTLEAGSHTINGALQVNNSTVTIQGGTYAKNAIFANSVVTLEGGDYAGAVNISGSASNMTMKGSTFQGTVAMRGQVTVTENAVFNNTVSISTGTATVENASFTKAVTVNADGNLVVKGGTLTSATIKANGSAHFQGGSISGTLLVETDGELTASAGSFGTVAFQTGGKGVLSGGYYANIYTGGEALNTKLAAGYAYFDQNGLISGDYIDGTSVVAIASGVTVAPHSHDFRDFHERKLCGCGAQAVATVTVGETVSYYETIETALTAAQEKEGCTLTLLEGLTENITIPGGSFTLDMANRESTGRLSLSGTADVTLKNSNIVRNSSDSATRLVVMGGKLTVESGTIYNADVQGDGEAILKGGTIGSLFNHDGTITVPGSSTLRVSEKLSVYGGTVRLSGGYYSKITGWNSTLVENFLAEGYAYKRANTWPAYAGLKEIRDVSVAYVPLQSIALRLTAGEVDLTYGYQAGEAPQAAASVVQNGTASVTYLWELTDENNTKTTLSSTTGTGTLPVGLAAGSYQLTCTATCEGYSLCSAPITITVAKVAPGLTRQPAGRENLVYCFTEQTLITAGTVTGGEWQYSLNREEGYSTALPTGTDAGQYTVWYKVVGDANHLDTEPASLQVVIVPLVVTAPRILLDGRCTYNGQPQRPTVTLMADATHEIPAEEYTVEYGSNINAGVNTATVTIKDRENSNFTVSGSGSFSIEKAAAPTLAPLSLTQKYTDTTQHTVPRDYAALMPQDAGRIFYLGGNYMVPSGVTLPGWSVNAGDGTVTYRLEGATAEMVGQTITIPVIIVSQNYKDATAQLVITLLDKDTPELSAEGIEMIYTGSAVPLERLTETAAARWDGNEIDGHWRWKNGSPTNVNESGDYYAVFEPEDTVNFHSAEIKVSITILPRDIAEARIVLGVALTYTGRQQRQEITSVTLPGYREVTYRVEGDTAADAGNYELVVSGTDNFTGSVRVGYTVARATLENVSVRQSGTLTYNGSAQQAAVTADAHAAGAQEVTFTYSTEENGPYGEMPAFTGAGRYTVYYRAEAANHQPATGHFTITIDRLDLSEASIVWGPMPVYTGSAQNVPITAIKAGGLTLGAGDYTVVSGGSGTAAGDYRLKIAGAGNFTGTKEMAWKIEKAAQNLSAPTVHGTYGGRDRIALEGAIGTVTHTITAGEGVIALDEQNTITFLRAGSASILVKADGDENHQAAEITVAVQVEKAVAVIKAQDKKIYVGNAAPDLTQAVPGTDYIIDGLVTGDILEWLDIGIELTYPVTPDTTKPGQFAIRPTVLGHNACYEFECEDGTLTVARYPVPAYTWYTIRTITGAHGTISPSGWVSVREGWDQTFTITPDEGYTVAAVRIDGKYVGIGQKYTFRQVSKDHTIEVTFRKGTSNPGTGAAESKTVGRGTGALISVSLQWVAAD